VCLVARLVVEDARMQVDCGKIPMIFRSYKMELLHCRDFYKRAVNLDMP